MTLQFQTVIAGMDKDKLPSKQREMSASIVAGGRI